MGKRIIEKLLSRKFWAVMIATLWWLVEGTLNGTFAEIGWKVVAVILGYLVAEGSRDILIAYYRGKEGK